MQQTQYNIIQSSTNTDKYYKTNLVAHQEQEEKKKTRKYTDNQVSHWENE